MLPSFSDYFEFLLCSPYFSTIYRIQAVTMLALFLNCLPCLDSDYVPIIFQLFIFFWTVTTLPLFFDYISCSNSDYAPLIFRPFILFRLTMLNIFSNSILFRLWLFSTYFSTLFCLNCDYAQLIFRLFVLFRLCLCSTYFPTYYLVYTATMLK